MQFHKSKVIFKLNEYCMLLIHNQEHLVSQRMAPNVPSPTTARTHFIENVSLIKPNYSRILQICTYVYRVTRELKTYITKK